MSAWSGDKLIKSRRDLFHIIGLFSTVCFEEVHLNIDTSRILEHPRSSIQEKEDSMLEICTNWFGLDFNVVWLGGVMWCNSLIMVQPWPRQHLFVLQPRLWPFHARPDTLHLGKSWHWRHQRLSLHSLLCGWFQHHHIHTVDCHHHINYHHNYHHNSHGQYMSHSWVNVIELIATSIKLKGICLK